MSRPTPVNSISVSFDDDGNIIFQANHFDFDHISKQFVPKNRFKNEIYCMSCPNCDGYGYIILYKGIGKDSTLRGTTCPECKGIGKFTFTEYFLGVKNDR